MLRNACEHAREAVVVTYFFNADLPSPTDSPLRFNPSDGGMRAFWWQFSPGWAASPARFQSYKQRSALSFGSTDYSDVSAFTVVGRR
jgi:hypothetical protein